MSNKKKYATPIFMCIGFYQLATWTQSRTCCFLLLIYLYKFLGFIDVTVCISYYNWHLSVMCSKFEN